jgi:rubrerythrin
MEYSPGPIASNLAKALEKQYRAREAELMWTVAGYFDDFLPAPESPDFTSLVKALTADETEYLDPIRQAASSAAEERTADRGALRAAAWGSKVNAIQKSLADRYAKKGDELLEGKKLFICEACGFIFLGDQAPDICPVCKAPALRFALVE